MKNSILVLGLLFSGYSAFASEPVKWTGVVQEEDGYHTNNHEFGHSLAFVRDGDKKEFDIVDSKALEELHSQKEKNLRVEVEGEKTGKFLFWGGNLIVKNFKVLEELDEIPHRAPRKSSAMDRGGRLR